MSSLALNSFLMVDKQLIENQKFKTLEIKKKKGSLITPSSQGPYYYLSLCKGQLNLELSDLPTILWSACGSPDVNPGPR